MTTKPIGWNNRVDKKPSISIRTYPWKCKFCGSKLSNVGFKGTGHSIYECLKCGMVFEIKQIND